MTERNFDFLSSYCEDVYLPKTPETPTAQIKQDLYQENISHNAFNTTNITRR